MTTTVTPKRDLDAGPDDKARTIRRVRVPAWALAATGSAANAIVLGQLMFWIYADAGRRARASVPGLGILGPYVFKAARELAAETGLTASQCERAIPALMKKGIIATKRRKFRGSPTNAIWLTPAALKVIHDHEDDRRVVSVLPSVVAHMKHANAALLASQMIYWVTRRDENGNTLTHAPRPGIGVHSQWIAKTHAQLSNETGLSANQVKRASALLVKRGLVRTTRCRFGDGTATRYELAANAVQAMIAPPKLAEVSR